MFPQQYLMVNTEGKERREYSSSSESDTLLTDSHKLVKSDLI